MAVRAQAHPVEIPAKENTAELVLSGRAVRLTNLNKLFWPELGITKRALLQYYADISPALLPHLAGRGMVMRRYPDGAAGPSFFMKQTPSPHPEWLAICTIEHATGKTIRLPMVEDLASLLWTVNLGCIDLNPWYGRADAVDRPDYLHFDLDPVPGASWEQVVQTALILREALASLHIPNYPKTTGSRGIHVYVPIVRGPTQEQVWTFAKALARALAARNPALITTEYKVAKRPHGRVLVDYNQNSWGRTLASVYSVRPKPLAPVSAPLTWEELERGAAIADFRLDNMPARVRRLGDLFKPVVASRGRVRLERFFKRTA